MDNTFTPSDPSTPDPTTSDSLYDWPPPGLQKPGEPTTRLNWAAYLRAWGQAIDRLAGSGEVGLWLGNWLVGLSLQAEAFQASTPAEHLAAGEREAARQREYINQLEQDATTDPCDPGAMGCLLGLDERCMRAWICPPCDPTNYN